ncbi:MAG: hypothetical protein R2689_05745 [Microthrixaceae bacterium]|nr:hypothetical protein [Microthrixaceae bacterium]
MTVITLASVRGAPGVTTISLLIAGCIEGAALVEADLAGGVLAIRYDLGREPGLTTLAASRMGDADEWLSHAQSAGGVPVLVGPDAPDSSEALWRGAGARLATGLCQIDAAAVVVDVGRLGAGTPMLEVSDLLVVLVEPIAEHLVTLGHRLPTLRRAATSARIGVVLVGDGPYRAKDIAASLEVDVLGELPDDSRAASVLIDGGRSPASFARTRLARSAAGLSADLLRVVDGPTRLVEAGR